MRNPIVELIREKKTLCAIASRCSKSRGKHHCFVPPGCELRCSMCSCNKQCVALCLAWALLLQLALAGFSCLSNPCLYGICMDEINSVVFLRPSIVPVLCSYNHPLCQCCVPIAIHCASVVFLRPSIVPVLCSYNTSIVSVMCFYNHPLRQCCVPTAIHCVSVVFLQPSIVPVLCSNNHPFVVFLRPSIVPVLCSYNHPLCQCCVPIAIHCASVVFLRPSIVPVLCSYNTSIVSVMCFYNHPLRQCCVPTAIHCVSVVFLQPSIVPVLCSNNHPFSYTCYCMDGYTGNQCSTNWDECWSSPCGNGATCVDGVATFNCSCPPGFAGPTCEEDVDECQSNPCFNNGICQDGVNGYSCTCLPGYQGVLCEVDIAVCNMTGVSLCINGGVCIEGPGDTFSCACLQGWTGQICETAVDECVSSPCQNGGVCVDLFAGYSCACPFGMLAFFTCKSGFSPGPKVRPFCVVTGYTGSNCEVKLHPCLVSPCLNQALCLVEAGTRVCYCVPDYHGDRCQFQYDECVSTGELCLDGVDNYTCSCPPDLTGSLCECLIMGPGLLDCSYISPTPLSLMSETVTDQTSSTVGPVTWQHTLVYDNITLTSGWTSVGQSEAATSTTTPAGGFTTNYPETSTDTSSQQVPEETVSGLSSQLLTGTISSPRSSEDSTQTFVETESAVTPRVTLDMSGGTEGYFTSRHQPRVSTEGVYDEITTLETSGTTQIFGLPGTTQTAGLPGTKHTSELPDTTQASELPGTTQTSEPPPTTQTDELPTTTQTDEPPTTTQTDELSGTTQTGELPGTTQTSELSGPTPECPETEYTSGTVITAITYPSSTEISSTTDLGSSSESVFYSTSTEEQSVDCSVFPCQNSGTCVYTKGGPRGLNWSPVVVRNLGGRVESKILKSPVDLVVHDDSPTDERTKEYESDNPHVGICRRPVTRFIRTHQESVYTK
uniref:EGF-like domain-containing protein n=1 Tax=Timema poppense TaxID=170557 RepID=A0A7R9DI42_TIMPO|nr:unnamed protein product [Timema poppensis]